MPKDLQPLTDEGTFFYFRINRHEEDKSISTKTYSNKPQWDIYPDLYKYYAKGGTDAQAEILAKKNEAEAITGDDKLGVMIIYYGVKSTNTFSTYSAWTLYGKKHGLTGKLKNEAMIADMLSDRTLTGKDYLGYYYIDGGGCNEAEVYISRKFQIAAKQMRFYGSCQLQTFIKNE